MRWQDERYVRVYTRDTIAWKRLPWQSRALMPLMLRVADRAGLIDLETYGAEGLAELVMLPLEVVQPGLAGLLADGTVSLNGQVLAIRNFIEAQEIPMSDAQRKREQRARDREKHLAPVTRVTDVTHVTDTCDTSRIGHSDPICSDPVKTNTARARVDVPSAQGFGAIWGAKTGELMADAYQLGEVRKKLESYAEATGRAFDDVAEAAHEAFVAEVQTWDDGRPLTARLFNAKWSEIQARMAGKVPAAKGRSSRAPPEPKQRAYEDLGAIADRIEGKT